MATKPKVELVGASFQMSEDASEVNKRPQRCELTTPVRPPRQTELTNFLSASPFLAAAEPDSRSKRIQITHRGITVRGFRFRECVCEAPFQIWHLASNVNVPFHSYWLL